MTPEPRTDHFRVGEWNSSHPKAKPYPEAWVEERWFPLANMLEKIRARAKGAIKVTANGGYRCDEHNAAVGGAKDSQHKEGRAADIQCHVLDASALHRLILKMHSEGDLPELGGLGLYETFVHVDTRKKPGGHLAQWGGSRAADMA